MSLRRAGRMHHLGVGAKHARTRVLALADDHHITVTDLTTGEILSAHLIEPEKTYWRNQTESQAAGLAPQHETHDARHPRPMSRDNTDRG
jgi:hypothetical protein